MQQNEVYTLYKNYTSDIMQALKQKIEENNKLKENINIKETYKCYSDYAVMYNKGINKCLNDNFEVKNREIFIKVKKDNEFKYIFTQVNSCSKCNLPYISNKRMKKLSNYLNEFCHNKFLQEKKVDENGNSCVEKFGIATPSIEQLVCNLSGGNQQKVLLATWFGINPKLLIVDEPTRGVDVGARADIYTFLRELAKTGVGIIMISSDLPEVLGVSDRIVVMKSGEIVGQLRCSEANEENVIAMATGIKAL